MPDVLSEVFDPSSNVQVALVANLWYEGETGKLKSLAAGKCACIFVDPSTGNAYWRTFNASSANEEVTAWASDTLIGGREEATAAPTSGTYAKGAIVWNSAPAAGGFVGWVCVTAGSPGTWKGFGVIES